MKTHPVLILHGGAGSRLIGSKRAGIYASSLQTILDQVVPRLNRGATALECVVEAVRLLENDPLYNAGRGSKIQSDGKIRMSSALMDGQRRRFSGCVNVERVKNPILLARALLNKKDRVLACQGAQRFARQAGLQFGSNYTAAQLAEYKNKKRGKSGTVGALALDANGHLAAATSTGGRGFEFPYRVSDSPTVAGNFANGHCAVSATGTGEEIVELAVASSLCTLVEAGVPLAQAAARIFKKAAKDGREFGMIALDQKGGFHACTTTPSLVWAVAHKGGYSILGRETKY